MKTHAHKIPSHVLNVILSINITICLSYLQKFNNSVAENVWQHLRNLPANAAPSDANIDNIGIELLGGSMGIAVIVDHILKGDSFFGR